MAQQSALGFGGWPGPVRTIIAKIEAVVVTNRVFRLIACQSYLDGAAKAMSGLDGASVGQGYLDGAVKAQSEPEHGCP